MSRSNRPMVVGAGPVGLGAALFLAKQGRATRVVEMRGEPSQQSRALAVNPRTLDLLEPTAGRPREVAKCQWLLAADGVRRRPRPPLLPRRGRVPVPDPRGR
jgi:NADPH-dependent 2,4-dienoyl-CoA reductase/sulfur reductase-like enzyme